RHLAAAGGRHGGDHAGRGRRYAADHRAQSIAAAGCAGGTRRGTRAAQHRAPPGLRLRPARAHDLRLGRGLLCLRAAAAAGRAVAGSGGEEDAMKVVIAADEPLARERLRSRLAAHADIEVVAEAGDGRAALQACAEHEPDFVLLDIAMPGIDGLEAARHLAAFEPRPAAVFCTAYPAHARSAFDAAPL